MVNKIIDKLNREHKIRYMRQHNIDNRTVLATHRVQQLVETEFIYNIRKQLQGGRGVVLVEFVHTMLDLPFIILAFISLDAFKKHSSKVLHGNISALGLIDNAAKCEYAPKVP